MSPIFSGSHSGVGTHNLALDSQKRLVNLDKLVYQIIEALLIIWILSSLDLNIMLITLEVLSQDLFEVLVQFLSILILRKMLLIILDELLNLFLQLLIRHDVLRRGIILLSLILVRHTCRVVAPLVHLLVAAKVTSLAHRLPRVVPTGYTIVLVVNLIVLALILLVTVVQLRL